MQYEFGAERPPRDVCMFGPGGEYCRPWPGDAQGTAWRDEAGMFGQLGLALGSLASALLTLGRRLNLGGADVVAPQAVSAHGMDMVDLNAQALSGRVRSGEKIGRLAHAAPLKARQPYRTEKPANDAYATTDPDCQADRPVPLQQWLFADDARDGRATATKQGNRVRARRGARAKRVGLSPAQQGTLFDT